MQIARHILLVRSHLYQQDGRILDFPRPYDLEPLSLCHDIGTENIGTLTVKQ